MARAVPGDRNPVIGHRNAVPMRGPAPADTSYCPVPFQGGSRNKENRMNSARVWGIVVLACVLGCGGGGDGGTGPGPDPGSGPGPGPGPGPNPGGGTTSNAVDVNDDSFDPSQTTVAPNTTVT